MISNKTFERAPDNAAPVIFAVFTVAGMVTIVCAKLWFGVDRYLAAAMPVAFMIAYAAMILFARGLRLRNDQTGDNFYYMGFLFTLTSLGVALFQFVSPDEVDLDAIIQNFGIALASTIVGIGLRIMFNQVRRDPIEFEQVARLDLADAARRVRREMDGIQQEISHFRRTNQQMLQEAFEETRSQLATIGTAATTSIEVVRETAIGGLEDATKVISENFTSPEVKKQLERSSKSLDRVNTKLEEASDRLANAASDFAAKVSGAQGPDKVIEVSLEPAISSLQEAITGAVDRLTVQLKEVGEIARELSRDAKQTRGPSSRRSGLFGLFRRRGRRGNSDVTGNPVGEATQ